MSTTQTETRPARAYTVTMDQDGVEQTETITVEAGPEADQDAEAKRLAGEAAEAWMLDGEWGDDGASVSVGVEMTDGEYEWPRWTLTVEIPANEDALMRAAGADPDCDHEWTAEGEGGCDENPGVWSTGGTSMTFATHCAHCGLRRLERVTGSQRNPGEHDTVEFSLHAGAYDW